MAWRDWIEPLKVSQESQLSASQIAQKVQKNLKKDPSSELATVTVATPATDEPLLTRCRRACSGLDLDPAQLAAWLIEQADPDWLHPAPIHWWAQRIARHGYPKEE